MDSAHFTDDTELLAALRTNHGLDGAVKSLYRAHFESLSTYILQNSGSRQDAEDIFQEVLLTFIELVQLGKFRQESSIRTFLYALNRNIWLNELKRRDRANSREKRFEMTRDDVEKDVSHAIAGREARKEVLEILGNLGETCSKILLAFYYENLSIREILKTLNYENEQVVRNKKYKCLKQLADRLQADPRLAQTLKIALKYE